MKRTTTSLLGLFALASLPVDSCAQNRQGGGGKGQAGGGDIWSRMARHDADGDGKVSEAEFRGAVQTFARLDADKDGFVTKDEASKAKMQRGAGRAAGPDSAPQVGEEAPKVSAKKYDGPDIVDLSDPRRVTVLVFGSHT